MFKTFFTNTMKSKSIQLGRWKPNPNNFARKIDLANIDNCGDRVCGDLYTEMKPIIRIFDKRWNNEISNADFNENLKKIKKTNIKLNDNIDSHDNSMYHSSLFNNENYSIKSIVANYNERWNKNLTVEEYLINFTRKHRGAC